MKHRSNRWALAAVAPLLLCTFAATVAQEGGGAPTTRLLVTEVRVKPDKIADWLALERNDVVPALKKAGVKHYTVFQTLIGATNEYVIVRPLPTFAEFNGPGPLEGALGDKAGALIAKLRDCEESVQRRIENRHEDVSLDPGNAQALFVSRYRAMPGKAGDYMAFVHTEMYPVMVKAKANGTMSGMEVTTSVQGGEPGIITLNMYYTDFSPLDGPPPLAKTMGPQGTAEFLRKGAGLITQLEQRILKRVPDLSF